MTGDGPDVLLVHAGVNDRRGWRHVVAELSPDFRCVAYDMRGYGETEYEPEDGWAPHRDALAVLDAAGSERALVIGCSMGGRAAIDLALAHPERVGALLLIGTAVRGMPDPGTEGLGSALDEAAWQAAQAGDFDGANRLEARLWLDGPEAPEGRVGGEARELFLEMNGRALRAPEPGEEADVPAAWPRLGELAVPALLLLGRLDAVEVAERVEKAAERIPGARLERLDGVAHVPHLEADAGTLAAIRTFVAAHAKR